MQTNSIRINTWDALFTMFTTLEPEDRRMAVLYAIADPETEIGHTWDDCLFAVATRAVDHSYLKIIFKGPVTTTHSEVAKTLGIPLSWVNDGVEVWDGREDNKRPRGVMNEMFRSRIREHLAATKKTQTADKTREQVRELAQV